MPEATDVPELQTDLTLPPGWIGVPVDPSIDPVEWARASLAERTGEEISPECDAVVADLASAAQVVQEWNVHQGMLAAVFQPDPLGPVLVPVDIQFMPLLPEWSGWSAGLRNVEEMLRQQPGIIGDLVRRRAELPAGHSLSLRGLFRRDEDLLLEGYMHVIFPPKAPCWVLLSARWTPIAIGDYLAARVDELAAGLSIVIQPSAAGPEGDSTVGQC